MLTTLRIQNLAIAESLEVELGPGMNVVTGETGAGKSLLVDALGLLLGGRAQLELVRAGAEEAVVEGHFAAQGLDERLEALGLPTSAGELVIRRVVPRTGRGKVTVNGALCTVAMLAQLGRGLVDLAGQHEHVALLDSGGHLALLDAFGELGGQLQSYREKYEALLQVQRAKDAHCADDAERGRQIDYLQFQVRELEALGAEPGEEARLESERKRLAGAERIRDAGAAVSELLSGGDGAVDLVARAQGKLAEALALDDSLAPVAQGLRAGLAELDEAARTLSRHLDVLEANPGRLAEIDDRLDLMKRIARKHGCPSDGLAAQLEAIRRELDGLVHHEARAADLDAALAAARQEAEALAVGLSAARSEIALRFARAVKLELVKLGMPQIRFEAHLERSGLGPSGCDHAELFIGPNPGEPMLPLSKVASGGELSRVSLAIKRALAAADPVGTYVFDEVDAGIGGSVAEAVGRMLKGVAAHRQVLCITHLPQVAAFADAHLMVRKQVLRNRTVAVLRPLVEVEARQAELARMLAGAEVGAAALEHARALIDEARRPASPRPRRTSRPPRLRAVGGR